MDLQRIAQQFKAPRPPVRARFGSVVQVNADYTIDVLVGGMTTDADADALATGAFTPGSASGGDSIGTAIIDDVPYRVHTFTTNGTLTLGTSGTNTSIDFLVVGGGGGGGGAVNGMGGGGGAGEVVFYSQTFGTVGAPAGFQYVVTIGTGGAGGGTAALTRGFDGGQTLVDFALDSGTIVAVGGGGGGAGGTASLSDGVSGASGGGGGVTGLTAGTGAAGVPPTGFGNDGGSGSSAGTALSAQAAGGGGGAFTPARNGVGRLLATSTGGSGGQGYYTEFTGTGLTLAGGGGGGASVSPGVGGAGGGGNGGDAFGTKAGDAVANTGGGGGGGAGTDLGGDGGSGVVYVRYQLAADDIVPLEELGETESDQVSAVPFLGQGVPIPGQTVLLLTDGQDLVALDSLAQSGSTIAARRYRAGDFEVDTATDTTVTWGFSVNALPGMVLEPGEEYQTERIYAVIPGWYQATGAVLWEPSGTGFRRVGLRLNGSTLLAGEMADAVAGVTLWQNVVSPPFYMAVDDYVVLEVRQNSGGPLDLVYDSEYLPSLSLTFLGP